MNDRKQKLPPMKTTGYLLNPEFATMMHTLSAIGEVPEPLPEAGPNKWDEITIDDFGPEEDYFLQDEGSIVIFYPVSNAALQWCYRFLPEDCPRWGALGFAIERRYIGDIVKGAQDANLMSDVEFEEAEAEEHNLRTQWEDQ